MGRIDGVMLFRAACGAWFVASPWLVGRGLDLVGAIELAVGLAMFVVAWWAQQKLALRIMQAALGLGVALAGLLLDSTDLQVLCDFLGGKVLFLSALVSSEIFDERREPA